MYPNKANFLKSPDPYTRSEKQGWKPVRGKFLGVVDCDRIFKTELHHARDRTTTCGIHQRDRLNTNKKPQKKPEGLSYHCDGIIDFVRECLELASFCEEVFFSDDFPGLASRRGMCSLP